MLRVEDQMLHEWPQGAASNSLPVLVQPHAVLLRLCEAFAAEAAVPAEVDSVAFASVAPAMLAASAVPASESTADAAAAVAVAVEPVALVAAAAMGVAAEALVATVAKLLHLEPREKVLLVVLETSRRSATAPSEDLQEIVQVRFVLVELDLV
jgi:hypothetical protein